MVQQWAFVDVVKTVDSKRYEVLKVFKKHLAL
jgi:hypothetical protein